MPFFLADHTEDAERRWMALDAGRYRRLRDQRPIVVKRDALIRDRDDDLERTLRSILRLTLLCRIGFCVPVMALPPEWVITPPMSGLGPEQGPAIRPGMRRRRCRKQANGNRKCC